MISHIICQWMFISIFPPGVILYKDIVFLVDKSSSLSQEDFSKAVDFMYNVTRYIPVGPAATQFSVVTFSSDVTELFDLNDYSTNAALLTAIKGLKSITPSGSTYTYDALTFARTSSFISSKGSRSNAGKVVIVLTDGQSVNMVKTATEAQLLKDKLNAEVFSIGIGSAISSTNAELLNISSDPDSYYSQYVTSYLGLCSLVPSIVPKLDPTAVASTIPGCAALTTSAATAEENTAVVASVAAVAAVSGIGLTALVASLLQRKLRGILGKNKVDTAVNRYNNQFRRETSRAIFDTNSLNDPSARQVPLPDNDGADSPV